MKASATLLFLLVAVWIGCKDKSSENSDTTAAATPSEDNSVPAVSEYSKSLPLEKLKLPEGFKIEIFAEVDNARSLTMSPSGIVYVGNRHNDKVYAVKDTNGDYKADKKWVLASGLNMPNGVAFYNGDLYVAEVSRVIKFIDIESRLENPGPPVVVNDQFPTETHHGWKYIAFGPDAKLYISVGAPCNICEPKDAIFATITRMNPDGTGREIFAHGVRNTVGFTWHPNTNQLWFTDNGRDMMGDDVPECELNVAQKAGEHFGYPYCHEESVKDPEFGQKRGCSEFISPVQKMGAHVAPLGLKFYSGNMFPEEFKNQLFVARHGSWNRTNKSGYDVMLVHADKNTVSGMEPFITGWLDDATQKAWGRPVDVLQLADGSLLLSDDHANVIYRIFYQKG